MNYSDCHAVIYTKNNNKNGRCRDVKTQEVCKVQEVNVGTKIKQTIFI